MLKLGCSEMWKMKSLLFTECQYADVYERQAICCWCLRAKKKSRSRWHFCVEKKSVKIQWGIIVNFSQGKKFTEENKKDHQEEGKMFCSDFPCSLIIYYEYYQNLNFTTEAIIVFFFGIPLLTSDFPSPLIPALMLRFTKPQFLCLLGRGLPPREQCVQMMDGQKKKSKRGRRRETKDTNGRTIDFCKSKNF